MPDRSSLVLGQAYLPRLIDEQLQEALRTAGAVVVEGARATGKTMTALHACASHVFVDDPAAQELLAISASALLSGPRPRLIDEWQLAPELWNLVRRAVDATTEPRQFILTGSAVPSDDVTRHTGAGRFLRLRQRTLTWFEKSAATSVPVSLAALFDGERPRPDLDAMPPLDSVINTLLTPGFPAMRGLSPRQSAARLNAYAGEVARVDVPRLAAIRHSPEVITQLLRAVSRSVASEVTYRTLASDLRSTAPAITAETVAEYLGLLERLFIVETQPAWTPHLRSRARVRTSPKWHLLDPALAAAILGANASRLARDPNTTGVLFESAVVHDLTVFAERLGGAVHHYRDSNNKEIDAVIVLPDGRWAAIEIKLGGRRLQQGIDSLQRAIADIDTDTVGEPAVRLVITGTGPVLTADDGTVTCPLGLLGP